MVRYNAGQAVRMPGGVRVHMVAARYGQSPAAVRAWPVTDFLDAVNYWPVTGPEVPNSDGE